jgi:hypothetical protein
LPGSSPASPESPAVLARALGPCQGSVAGEAGASNMGPARPAQNTSTALAHA